MINFKAEYITSGTREEHFPEHDQNEFMLCGRSNVGKSSFINTFLNRKALAYTSSKPGKTQALSFFHINDAFYFVDVPGYGYAKVSKKQREEFGEMIEGYITTRENLKTVILLVDARHKPSNDDVLMYDFLKYYEIPVVVVATKVDKIGRTKLKQHEKQIRSELKLDSNDKLFMVSSDTKEGIDNVRNYINEIQYT